MQTERCRPLPCGRGPSTGCSARRPILAPLRRTTGGFSKQSSGRPGRGRHGATFRSPSATGTASSSASAAGHSLAPSSECSTPPAIVPSGPPSVRDPDRRQGHRRGLAATGSRGARGGDGASLKTEPRGNTGPRTGEVQVPAPDRDPLRKD